METVNLAAFRAKALRFGEAFNARDEMNPRIKILETKVINLSTENAALKKTIHEIEEKLRKETLYNNLNMPMGKILRAVCEFYMVGARDILSDRRSLNLSVQRHVVMYLARMHTLLSLPQIGRFMRRHHSTVLHAIHNIEVARIKNKKLDDEIEVISGRISKNRV